MGNAARGEGVRTGNRPFSLPMRILFVFLLLAPMALTACAPRSIPPTARPEAIPPQVQAPDPDEPGTIDAEADVPIIEAEVEEEEPPAGTPRAPR
jgi:hypothetical protein